MKFDELISGISSALDGMLPGQMAHKLATPSNRKGRLQDFTRDPDHRLSAVLALLYPMNGELHLCLMRRPTYNGTHSRQVSFPGGKVEESDNDLLDTALRETTEEVGVDRNSIEILGQLTEVYIPPSRFLVQPFVGYIKARPDFVLNEEVEELIEVPIQLLLDEGVFKVKPMVLKGVPEPVNIPYFDLFDNHVWGATGMMLKELVIILRRAQL